MLGMEREYGQCDPPTGSFITVAGGIGHTVGLKQSGELVCWGRQSDGQCDLFSGGIAQITADADHTLLLISFDCDKDGISDTLEISIGTAVDLNKNGIDDNCDPDCDGDGVPDFQEIASGAFDCNANMIPDICEISVRPDLDTNGNTFIDTCEVDYNANATFDFLDIYTGASQDIDANGIPDECDECNSDTNDCNNNGISDACDVLFGGVTDINGNFHPRRMRMHR